MFPHAPDWAEIRLRVDREGRCLDNGEALVWSAISPDRRALFGTLIRLAFRGRCSQFRLIGLGPFKGRCWQWTIEPVRTDSAIIAAELICRQQPPAKAIISPGNPSIPAANLPTSPVPGWLPS